MSMFTSTIMALTGTGGSRIRALAPWRPASSASSAAISSECSGFAFESARGDGKQRRNPGRVVVRAVEHLAVSARRCGRSARSGRCSDPGSAGAANDSNEIRPLPLTLRPRREGEWTLESLAQRSHARLFQSPEHACSSFLAAGAPGEATFHVVGGQRLDVVKICAASTRTAGVVVDWPVSQATPMTIVSRFST
mgnify:CR=1 FL=1